MKPSDELKHVACPLCGSSDLKKITEQGQFGLQCHVSICPNDGLVFLSPRWSRERYQYFYQSEYDSYYRPAVFGEETDEQKYRHIRQICGRLETFNLMEERNAVLDVGSGMGWALDWLKKAYPQVKSIAAIESSEHCINHMQNNLGATVIGSDVEAEWRAEPFDLIIMRHVLEHTLDPVRALSQVRKNLSLDGVAYVAVPNMLKPKGDLLNYWFRTVHTFYFSGSTLTQVAHRAGLEVAEIQCWQSEVWAIFKRPENVYHKQLNMLNRALTQSKLVGI